MSRLPAARVAALAVLPAVVCAACVSRQPSATSPLAGLGSSSASGSAAIGGSPPTAQGDRTSTPRPAPAPPPPLPADAWPPRIPIDQIEQGGREVYLLPSELAPPEERVSIGRRGLGELFRVDVDRIASASDLERIRRDRGFREWLVFQTYLGYVGHDAAVTIEQMSPDGTVARSARAIDLVEISETSFAIYLPDGTPRGLVLQLTNLAGNTEWERGLTEAFHREGWAVLSTFVPDGWAATDRLAVDRSDPPERTGVRLAEAIDDRLAEWAYGVEALLDYMQERYPEVPQSPLIGVGSSVGAISLPAVAARLAERPSSAGGSSGGSSGGGGFDAAVLIGGGIDGLSVLRNTTLQSTPVRLQWADDKRPDRATWEVIRRTYLEHARLDGTATCAYLRGRPVLLLHAAYDRIVDANCGEALWEVLGRPERWIYQTGHLGLFVFWVPLEIDRIVRWVNGAVANGAVESGAVGAGSATMAE